jgi:hypothetical protein
VSDGAGPATSSATTDLPDRGPGGTSPGSAAQMSSSSVSLALTMSSIFAT